MLMFPLNFNLKSVMTASNKEALMTLLKSNIACHLHKPVTKELIHTLSQQIIESIDYFIHHKDGIK